MAAGIATFDAISTPGFYERLEQTSRALEEGVTKMLQDLNHPAKFCRVGSIFYLWFNGQAASLPRNYADIRTGNTAMFAEFFQALLAEGVYVAPSAFEVGFVSAAHNVDHVNATVTAMTHALQRLQTTH